MRMPKRFFTLLELLAVICVIAIPANLMANDKEIVTKIESLGGKVTLKEGLATHLAFTECSKLDDASFQLIGQLSHLKHLTLYNKCHGLNDKTLVHLLKLKNLETLGTDAAQFTDEGLKQFTQLPNLRTASFFHTSFGNKDFTGIGFGHLKGCPKLDNLTVAGISMSDAGFAAIATIIQLKTLSTWHTWQTEAGNAHIASLPNLQHLMLGQRLPGGDRKAASLSDFSIPTLAKIKSLETLKIGEARFTAEALGALKALPKIKVLTLYESQLTAMEINKLRESLPGVKIDWQAATEEDRKKLEMYLK